MKQIRYIEFRDRKRQEGSIWLSAILRQEEEEKRHATVHPTKKNEDVDNP